MVPTATANLCVTSADGGAPEHTHLNPYLWLHVLGAYRETGDGGEHVLDGPAAMFFPAGSAHSMAVGGQGLGSVIVEFDSEWLGRRVAPGVDLSRPRVWAGGAVGRRASLLGRLWLSESTPVANRFAATATFLAWAMNVATSRPAPGWLKHGAADADGGLDAFPLVAPLGVSRSRLTRTYRRWTGEGLTAALRRRRVAAAAMLIEGTDLSLADIAAAAGFCDQSHMNRGFRLLLGRTPAKLRSHPLGFARRPAPSSAAPLPPSRTRNASALRCESDRRIHCS
jgi:AraC family transcriptional regulator